MCGGLSLQPGEPRSLLPLECFACELSRHVVHQSREEGLLSRSPRVRRQVSRSLDIRDRSRLWSGTCAGTRRATASTCFDFGFKAVDHVGNIAAWREGSICLPARLPPSPFLAPQKAGPGGGGSLMRSCRDRRARAREAESPGELGRHAWAADAAGAEAAQRPAPVVEPPSTEASWLAL